MEKLDGIQLSDLDFKPLKMGDLLYHEGPLLSHFVDEENPSNQYFYKWSDQNDTVHRWMIFKVTERDLSDFFKHKNTLLDIIRHNTFVYFIDLEPNMTSSQVVLVATSDVPAKYLPFEGSGFDETGFEDYALELKSKISVYRSTLNRLKKDMIKKVAL